MEISKLRNSVKIVKNILGKASEQVLKYKDDRIPVIPFVKGKEWDYQSGFPNKAFNILKKKKQLGDFKSAADVATHLANYMLENHSDMIKSAEGNSKGFLFVLMSEGYLLDEMNKLLAFNDDIKVENVQEKETVVVDFSSPNIAKEMHVGHLRSTIIGESICRVLEFLGHDVRRVNHIGDWGTQFGMLIAHMMDLYPNYLEKQPELKDLETFYKESKKRFDSDEEFKKRAQTNVVKLQSGDEDFLKAWKILCDVSRTFFVKIYTRLDITNKEYGESFYNSMIPSVIEELEGKDLIKVDKGAKCLFVPKKKVPLMVQKSDGGYNYDTTDLAAARFRLLDWKANRVIYLTDVGQFPHFDLIFRASAMAGWHTPPKTRMEHMGFGIVLGEDGGRIKTREGKSVKLMDLLDEAASRAKAQLEERFETGEDKEGSKTKLEKKDIDHAAEVMGIAAVKYFDLRQNRIQNYKFSFDAMLNQKGDTAVYLMYSYIRICSIIRKMGVDEADLKKKKFVFTDEAEKLMARQLIRFPETLDMAQDKLQINRICEFLYVLAVRVAEAYNLYKVLNNEHTESRILLILAVKKMMEKCFFLLGIKTIDRI
jgi:arginyl-tRNA synthetase